MLTVHKMIIMKITENNTQAYHLLNNLLFNLSKTLRFSLLLVTRGYLWGYCVVTQRSPSVIEPSEISLDDDD